MAAAAKIDCYCCGETVAVNLNKSNRAYYHCGHCGVSVQSKSSDSTERMLKKKVIPATTTTTPTVEPTKTNRAPVVTTATTPTTAPKRGGFATLLRTTE